MTFSFETIELILALKKHNSMSKAANSLYISEPALSKQLRKIEKELGYDLVIRTNNGCSLTKAGEVLASKGIKIIKQRDILLNEMADIARVSENSNNKLRFGLANCYSETILAKFLPEYITKYPNINVELLINKTDVLEKMCLENEVDIILTQAEYCDNRLETKELTKENIVVLLPIKYSKDKKLKEYCVKGSIPLKVLENYPNAECQGHERFQNFLKRYYDEVSFKPNVVFQSESWTTIIPLIQNEMCYCIMPDIFDLSNDNKIIKLRIDSKLPTSRTLALAYKSRNKLRKEWQSFIDIATNRL